MAGTAPETRILEINLISAQRLKLPSSKMCRIETYAIAWVDPSAKLRSAIDRIGGDNPTWNEKFIFPVAPDFIYGETSGVSVEIYAVGYIRDYLVGTVRFLLSTCLSKSGAEIGTPAFSAVHIRRPSGSFHGVLNIAATVYESSDFSGLIGLSAVCFRDLIGESDRRRARRRRLSSVGSKRSEQSSGGDSCDFSCGDLSDGTDSTTSSCSNTSTALNDWNGVRTENIARKKDLKSDSRGSLPGFMLQRRFSLCPSELNFQPFAGLQLQGRKNRMND